MGDYNAPKARPNFGATNGRSYVDKRANITSSGDVRWIDIDAGAMRTLVASITQTGGCCILGITSDGNALSVTLLNGNERIREYPRTTDEVLKLAQWVAENYA